MDLLGSCRVRDVDEEASPLAEETSEDRVLAVVANVLLGELALWIRQQRMAQVPDSSFFFCRSIAADCDASYDEFARAWDGSDTDMRMFWQLLGQLDGDELLIKIPEWLAEEKVGFVDEATPTLFIGRIARETEKAIRVTDSAAARPSMKLAHRIHNLQQGLEIDGVDDDRCEWLESRLKPSVHVSACTRA